MTTKVRVRSSYCGNRTYYFLLQLSTRLHVPLLVFDRDSLFTGVEYMGSISLRPLQPQAEDLGVVGSRLPEDQFELGLDGKLLRLLALLKSSTFTQKCVDFFLFLVEIFRAMMIEVTNAVKHPVNDELEPSLMLLMECETMVDASSNASNCASSFGLVEIRDMESMLCNNFKHR